jgi:hypothetical protein
MLSAPRQAPDDRRRHPSDADALETWELVAMLAGIAGGLTMVLW